MRSAHTESRLRRDVFEANAHRFALLPHVHRTQPFDTLCQEASIRPRYASGVHPIDDLGVRFHPSPAPLKEDSSETVETPLGLKLPTQHDHEGHQRVVQEKGPPRHDRLRADVAVRPLLGGPDG